jgi:hypothetical protein
MAAFSAELTTSMERPVGQCQQSPLWVRSSGLTLVKALTSQMSAVARVMMWGCIVSRKIFKSEAWMLRGKQDCEEGFLEQISQSHPNHATSVSFHKQL